ncbi:MAG: hypothetical protein OXL68_05975 [Paracoccaceae bacterium]|nr:hypothetical protein [Paracoccaceae bacterium]
MSIHRKQVSAIPTHVTASAKLRQGHSIIWHSDFHVDISTISGGA